MSVTLDIPLSAAQAGAGAVVGISAPTCASESPAACVSVPVPGAPGVSVRVLEWRPNGSAYTLGWADLLVTPPGLMLHNVRIVQNSHGLRVTFAARQTAGSSEKENGWPSGLVVSFPQHGDWTAFSDAVVAAIKAVHPEAFFPAATPA